MNSASQRERVLRLLRQLDPAADAHGWAVGRLGEGAQADVFVARAIGPDAPRPELVVKLYKGAGPGTDAVARDEYESLSRLHARVDGVRAHGWSVRTPEALFRGERPAGLVMTMVPGRPLNSLLRSGADAGAGGLDGLARAVAAALGRYWEGGSWVYGDIDFNNILCDPAGRTLSFVDPGLPERAYLCEGVGRDFYPASRDLAYILFDVAASVRSGLGRPSARRRQKGLAEAVVRASLGRAGSARQEARFLDEIHACARAHLGRIRASWSPAGGLRWALKRIAARGLDRAVRRLRAGGGGPSRSEPDARGIRGGCSCTTDRASR